MKKKMKERLNMILMQKVLIHICILGFLKGGFSQSHTLNQYESMRFCQYLKQNKIDSAYNLLDSIAKDQLNEEIFENTWNSIIQKTGSLEECLLNKKKVNDSDLVFIYCQFSNDKLDLKIAFSERNKILGFTFIPHIELVYCTPKYDKPRKYIEIDTTIKGEINLPAIVTLPKNYDSFPLVVFIHGSGPIDMDGTIGPNKILKDIAIGLAANGIGSVRYNKRTFVSQTMDSVTLEKEVINDVIAVLKHIESDKKLKGRKIYLIGHSLGAIIAPVIALNNSNISGVICMAASPKKMDEILVEQVNYLMQIDHGNSSLNSRQLIVLNRQIQYLHDSLSETSPASKLPMGIPASYWLSLKKYDFASAVTLLNLPLLFLQGERDYQVSTNDFMGIKKMLANSSNATFKSYQKLNHLFLEGTGISTPDEYLIPSNVPYYLIKDVSTWIKHY